MFTNLTTKQRVAIISLASLCLIGIVMAVLFLFAGGLSRQPADSNAEQRANVSIDIGITELLKRGVTSYQVDSIKNGLYQFAKKNNQEVARMTMNIDSIDRVVNYTGEISEDYAAFAVKLNSKQYNVRANLPGLSSAQVIVSDGETQVFDSGVIDLVSQGITR